MVVVGGDETLRARAVAAGFPVATSLEEWQTDRARDAGGMAGRGIGGDRWDGIGKAESVFVLPEPAPRTSMAAPREEMPEYVRRMRDLSGHYTEPLDAEPARDHGTEVPAHGRLPRITPRITMPLPTAALDPDGDTAEVVRRAQERREERITSAIRRTGSPLLGLDHLWAAGDPRQVRARVRRRRAGRCRRAGSPYSRSPLCAWRGERECGVRALPSTAPWDAVASGLVAGHPGGADDARCQFRRGRRGHFEGTSRDWERHLGREASPERRRFNFFDQPPPRTIRWGL